MPRFPSQTVAYRRKKHGQGLGISCPSCTSTNTYWRTRSRSWQCRRCGQQFDAQFRKVRREKRKP